MNVHCYLGCCGRERTRVLCCHPYALIHSNTLGKKMIPLENFDWFPFVY